MKHGAHGWHMGLLAAGVVAALLLGIGVGWALAIAVLGCAAMIAGVFWIGRSSVPHHRVESSRTRESAGTK